MQRITITENISLAYHLGSKSLDAAQNESLYGFKSGHEVRGQNLRVSTEWQASGRPEDARELKIQTKKILKSWDHSFLNSKQEFLEPAVSRSVTLENMAQVVWGELLEDRLLGLQIEQGSWAVEKSSALKPTELRLRYLTRFQSLLRAEKYIPLDLQLQLVWRGELDEQFGLIWPWSGLKKQLHTVQKKLVAVDAKFFSVTPTEVFLKEIAALIFQTSLNGEDFPGKTPAQLESVLFADLKDHWCVQFDLKDLSKDLTN